MGLCHALWPGGRRLLWSRRERCVQTRRQPEPETAAVPGIGTKGPKGPLNGYLGVKCAEGA